MDTLLINLFQLYNPNNMKKTRINFFSMQVPPVNAVFKKQFDEMMQQIPDGPGCCVVIGYCGTESKIIDLIKTSDRLRKAIKGGTKLWGKTKISRYRWIQEQVKQNQYDSIKIQIID